MTRDTSAKTKRQPRPGCKSPRRKVAPPTAPTLADLTDEAETHRLVVAARAYLHATRLLQRSPRSVSAIVTNAVVEFAKNNPQHPLTSEFCDGGPFIRWGNVDSWLRNGGDVLALLRPGGPSPTDQAEFHLPLGVSVVPANEAEWRERDAETPGFRN